MQPQHKLSANENNTTAMITPFTDSRIISSVSIIKKNTPCHTPGPTKHVRFSQYSSMHVYGVDPSYSLSKSYSSKECKAFLTRAAFDAHRLRQLITSCALPHAESVRFLSQDGVIKPEDFLGIEHLVHPSSYERVMKERRLHSDLLFQRQGELLRRHELDANSLAEMVMARSAKSADRARARAAMAA
ncbi:hypothetical protein ACHAW6_004417 [Cyclotella cf. meneghiniana]